MHKDILLSLQSPFWVVGDLSIIDSWMRNKGVPGTMFAKHCARNIRALITHKPNSIGQIKLYVCPENTFVYSLRIGSFGHDR
ncbi:MAG: hypothetical protein PHT87_09100, partial [Bacteroidales bacterium]|nr:hypothetical protein [Bacteroidales bacterium]